ncbi:hypothetical protein [Methylomonas koyamae]|uniref:hypothetical protein n=1 Tax=Methylomonas koyamae TaxID=702114 RepID=UPI000B2361BA|nr:hypothetical protein [Methylomonas koyamae]
MNGICRLCGLEKPLCNSHIEPKSFYRRMRNGRPQCVVVDVSEKPRAIRTNADYKQKLLCSDCEQFLSRNFENDCTKLLVDTNKQLETCSSVIFTEFNYAQFYLFVFTIIWRASVSTLKEYDGLKAFLDFEKYFRPCIFYKTLSISSNDDQIARLDDFIKLSIVKVIDHTQAVPQSVLDNVIIRINQRITDSIDDGIHVYFMFNGFLVTASLLLPGSKALKLWNAPGRLKPLRSIQKIPKQTYFNIPLVHNAFSAIGKTDSPFKK